MASKLMKMLGLDDEEAEYTEYEEQEEQPRRGRQRQQAPQQQQRQQAPARPRLVFYKGVPSESTKLKLRDSLLEGVMVMLDLHELTPREFEEQGSPFINFMGGVAFAHRGCMEHIDQAIYLVTPYEGMFEEWVEEEASNDGAFDRSGR